MCLCVSPCRESIDGHLVTPATVTDVINMGWTVKYVLRFDDDVEVRQGRVGSHYVCCITCANAGT